MRPNCIMPLGAFIEEVQQRPKVSTLSRWLKGEKMEVYVRKGMRLDPEPPNISTECLDIANVNIFDANNRGKGLFSDFITAAIKASPWPMIYFENATEIFGAHLERVFHVQRYDLPGQPFNIHNGCYYLLKQE